MGVAEEAGKVATSAVEALKGNPSCLAAILLSAIFALLVYFSLTTERRDSHDQIMALTERCFPLALMQAIRDEALEDIHSDR